MKYKFLQLWNYPFYKIDLKTIDVVRKVKLKDYNNNYEIIGTFTIKPPSYLIGYYSKYNKQSVIKYLNKYFVDNNFVKKYKKTVTTELGTQTVKFFYIFNLAPDVLVDYEFQGSYMKVKFKGVLVYKK